MSIQTLSEIYKSRKVRYIKPQYAYNRKLRNKDEIQIHQQQTAMEIAELMKAGKQVIYIDESQFHKQLVCERVWVRRDMQIAKPDGRGRGVSVIGAISEKQGLVHYHVLPSTNNSLTFSLFISELVKKIKGEAYVYMENFSVHTSALVKSHFNDRIQQRFLPAYSCTLNPIEKLWMVAKHRWKKLMIEKPDLIKNDEDLVREVKNLIESVKPQCSSLASCHIQHMVRSLRGVFV